MTTGFAERGVDFISTYHDNRGNRPHEDRRKLRRYRLRWKIERTNSWLKNHRCVTTRYNRSIIACRGFARTLAFASHE